MIDNSAHTISIENKVISEFDFTNSVTIGNDIIEAFPSLTTLQLKLFNMSVSAINTHENNKVPGVAYLSKEKLLSALDFKGANKKAYLKNKFMEFAKLQLYFELKDQPKSLYNVITTIKWDYPDNHDHIEVTFNEILLQSLFGLNTVFTKFRISECLSLESEYSILLFQHLIMLYNKGRGYGNVYLMNPTISVAKIREITHTKNKYKSSTANLRIKVIEPAIKEINEKTNLEVSVDSISNGKRILEFQFKVREKHTSYADSDSVKFASDFIYPEDMKYTDIISVYVKELNSSKSPEDRPEFLNHSDFFALEMIIKAYGKEEFLSAIRHMIIEQYPLSDLRYLENLLSHNQKHGVFPHIVD